MLPDFSRARKRFRDAYQRRLLNSKFVASDPFSESPRFVLQEGDRFVLQREDGSESKISFREISARIVFKKNELAKLTQAEVIKRVDEAAIEMARQEMKHSVETITQTLENTKQTVDARGEVFSPKHVFELFEKVWIEFEDGKPRMPTMMGPPQLQKRYLEVLDEIKSTPELMKRLNEILEKKKRDWDDRETDRRLVE